jgi:hypothetical protein
MRSIRIVAFAAALAFLAACRKKDPASAAPGAFVIRNLGVRFGALDPATNRAGDFLFLPGQDKVFLEFGARVRDASGGVKELPTFEYRIVPEARVTAVAEGRVVRFVFQEDTRDYEFTVRSLEDPDFEVGYDHVLEPRVRLDSEVAAGDTLGRPGNWDGRLGRFEIMVNRASDRRSYCPFAFYDPAGADAARGLVVRLMREWEAFKGDTTVYDEAAQDGSGCRMESMPSY